MTHDEVQVAISKATKGIGQYLDLQQRFGQVDVSADREFQRKYNAFYRVQRRQPSWYGSYYELMQELKSSKPTFADVLDRIHEATGRYEPSFASKLVATIDPTRPIWDVYVLANTNHVAPSYANKNKLSLAKAAYESIIHWYEDFLGSEMGQLCIREFNNTIPHHANITDLKKVDFILWQTRPAS